MPPIVLVYYGSEGYSLHIIGGSKTCPINTQEDFKNSSYSTMSRNSVHACMNTATDKLLIEVRMECILVYTTAATFL